MWKEIGAEMGVGAIDCQVMMLGDSGGCCACMLEQLAELLLLSLT